MNDQRWLDQMGTESPVMHPSHLAQKWQVLRMVLQGRSDGDRVRSLPSEIKLERDLHRGDSTECPVAQRFQDRPSIASAESVQGSKP